MLAQWDPGSASGVTFKEDQPLTLTGYDWYPPHPSTPKRKKNNEINHIILLRCSIKKKKKRKAFDASVTSCKGSGAQVLGQGCLELKLKTAVLPAQQRALPGSKHLVEWKHLFQVLQQAWGLQRWSWAWRWVRQQSEQHPEGKSCVSTDVSVGIPSLAAAGLTQGVLSLLRKCKTKAGISPCHTVRNSHHPSGKKPQVVWTTESNKNTTRLLVKPTQGF